MDSSREKNITDVYAEDLKEDMENIGRFPAYSEEEKAALAEEERRLAPVPSSHDTACVPTGLYG